MARTPRDLDDYRREMRERDIEREAQLRDERYSRPPERPRQEIQRREERPEERLAAVVNDPDIVIDKSMMESINDPDVVMMPTGEVARVTRFANLPRPQRSRFAAQFNTGMGFDLPVDKPKRRKRKKNPQLAKAFEKANKMGRKKRGKGFKKGWSQSRIASTAHRLVRQGRI